MMKIVAINGSPKGIASTTNIMVNAFLNGAQAEGAEIANVFLSEKRIEHCKGCHVCWTKGAGQCVTSDDMLGVIAQLAGADVIIFASPVYFENISGMLKVFFDRMTMIGGPQSAAAAAVKEQQPKQPQPKAPKLMMISSCGHPNKTEFDVISLWIKKVAQKMHMELIGEIYAAQSRILAAPTTEMQATVNNYLKTLESAGKEVVKDMKISENTNDILMQARNGLCLA